MEVARRARPSNRARRQGLPPADRQVTEQLLAAQDEERRRIGRELHDGTASTLVALSLELARLVECLPAGEGQHLAASCASLCEQSLRELRTVGFILHPPLLEREGLAVALQWLADGFSKRSGIHVTFDARTANGMRFAPHVELTLYRIAQEALTNVLRHSGSRTAQVTVDAPNGRVRLTIRDEGRRPPGARGTVAGVGIASMRERCRLLGGRLRYAMLPRESSRTRQRNASDGPLPAAAHAARLRRAASSLRSSTRPSEHASGARSSQGAGSATTSRASRRPHAR
jgi:signal transduction histidine kinase